MSDPAFVTWTDAEIREFILATAERESGFSRSASVGPITGLWEMAALAMQRGWEVGVRPTAEAINPERATGFYLRIWGIIAGVPFRATAGRTKGHVTALSVTGGTLRAGSVVEALTQRYTTDIDTTLPAGVETLVAVTAETGGAAGNVAAGAEAAFIAGTEPMDATVRLAAQWVTVVGFDADDLSTDEGTERYRQRMLAGLAVRGEANTIARYRFAALGVPGVSSVALGRTPRDYGSADLAVLVEGRLPTQEDLDLVRAAVELAGLVCRDLWVRPPRVVPVAVEAEITGTATVEAVTEAIDAWWARTIGIGDDVLVQALYREATIGVPGLDNIEFSSPVTNLDGAAATWYQPSISVTQAA